MAGQGRSQGARQFDEALAGRVQLPLYNKGLTLIQMNQFEAHNAPSSSRARWPSTRRAWSRPAPVGLKLQLAASFGQAQAVVDMLSGAMQNCRDKDSWWSCPPCARWSGGCYCWESADVV